MSFVRMLITSVLLGLVSGAAFIPRNQQGTGLTSKTVMQFKFLKEMGLEKPSWLPDFGGKKDEEPVAEAAASEEEEEEAAGEEEPVAEE